MPGVLVLSLCKSQTQLRLRMSSIARHLVDCDLVLCCREMLEALSGNWDRLTMAAKPYLTTTRTTKPNSSCRVSRDIA